MGFTAIAGIEAEVPKIRDRLDVARCPFEQAAQDAFCKSGMPGPVQGRRQPHGGVFVIGPQAQTCSIRPHGRRLLPSPEKLLRRRQRIIRGEVGGIQQSRQRIRGFPGQSKSHLGNHKSAENIGVSWKFLKKRKKALAPAGDLAPIQKAQRL
ncbi:MAG: hypothetical protein A2X36_11420 [Elusimicrobia bacterium GWA2_69_24]|nr:MAG: hypothetical protein A2X36_11420 [Elusimicrobia bacterium GWA2_69_24]